LAEHGYFNEVDARRILEAIELANPDVVLIGMGTPRQEHWALMWSAADRRPRVWWCVGALFEYYAGTRGRAPVWMRRTGLEWVWRLALEPGRLWRRYLLGNPRFLWRVWRGRPPRSLPADTVAP
ncbi:MAG: WecB/TagA/CpsF family glycosyltransferase, partial [bacterium]|nr:WecB/TagA/CpsF family glycosyltransferase [bacterium]